jgi:hypothetical protein
MLRRSRTLCDRYHPPVLCAVGERHTMIPIRAAQHSLVETCTGIQFRESAMAVETVVSTVNRECEPRRMIGWLFRSRRSRRSFNTRPAARRAKTAEIVGELLT